MTRTQKIIALVSTLAVGAWAVWYFFFRVKPAEELAASLGFYTGDTAHDNTLNLMLAQCANGGGAIAASYTDTGLAWELNDAAARLANPSSAPEDYWRVNGVLTPAGALLATIDVTHDSAIGGNGPGTASAITPEMLSFYDAYVDIPFSGNPESAAKATSEKYGGDYSVQEFETARQLLAGVNPAEAYIPQSSLNALWDLFDAYKNQAENYSVPLTAPGIVTTPKKG